VPPFNYKTCHTLCGIGASLHEPHITLWISIQLSSKCHFLFSLILGRTFFLSSRELVMHLKEQGLPNIPLFRRNINAVIDVM
jgi:hypothetical protein